ncbi:MAG: lactate utilization protein [Lachnospiraceae bacterium]|nr:lactate utilization protein [Lachnospiraceae bacterium]
MFHKQTYYEALAKTIIKNLAKRRMEGYYCATAAEAKEKILSMIDSGTEVAFGGAMTLNESGILSALRERTDITLLNRDAAKTPEEAGKIYRQAFSADTYLTSTNAITMDGELINIDGRGNRVAALIFGPGQVIVVAGMNKVATDEAAGLARVRNVAAPANCIRLGKTTPCTVTGRCGDCFGDASICSQIVVTRRSSELNRIKVILVGEELGY